MPKYETIPTVDEEIAVIAAPRSGGGEQPKAEEAAHWSKLTLGGVAALSMFLVALAMKSGAAATDAVPILELATTGTTTACTFDECYASNCNQKVAPFTCLFNNGGPHGGCSPTPWVEWSCTTSCDLSGCSDLDIPDDTDSCDQPCDEAVCVGDRLCHHDNPYQCTSGAAAFGCSLGPLEWTLKTSSATCSSCCNAKSCKK